MVYNIFFEVAALAFLIVINIHIRLQYTSNSLTNRRYKLLAFVLMITVALDVITAVTISYAADIPIWLNTILNSLYLGSDMILEYEFIIYCMICVYEKNKPAITYTTGTIVVLSFLLILANIKTGWIFSFDESGYVHGPIYMLVHVIPISAIIASSAILFSNFKKFNESQKLSIIMYSIIIPIGPVVQILYPHVLFILFTVSLGFMLLTFSLETPDYQKLNSTLEELRHTKEEAENTTIAAQNANKAKSEFMSAMSHEIRTPINAIFGYAETILRESEDEDISKCSGNLLTAGKRLLSIVNEIMDYTEMETGEFHLEENNYSSISFLMDTISCGEYYTENKNIEFCTNISENIPSVLCGDSVRLTQIFDNLISNAAKYTISGSIELNIDWENADDSYGFLSVSIKDTGIGMKEEDMAHISSSFLRMDKKNNQNILGIGLGLTIVTRLLSFMDSKLEVESQYRKGTVVSFRVKQKIADISPVGKVTSDIVYIQNKKGMGFTAPDANILVVDDNSINLDLICRILRETKGRIDTAANGAEALSLIGKNEYSIIFIDHMMPVMDGMETLSAIKNHELCPDTPIIVVTANAVLGKRNMYLEAGFDDYISKPVTGSRVGEILRKFIPHLIIENSSQNENETEKQDEDKKMHIIDSLSFLNTEAALTYCCEDKDFYIQILNAYLDENKTDEILGYYNENDMENYHILVHALKSASRTIGADYISEEALKLETAAKENDLDYIESHTQRFIDEYNILLIKLENALQI